MTSAILQKLIEQMALTNHWSPMSLDAMGHDRESGGFRRDMKHQPVGDAVAEMRVQQRDPHRFVVSFRTGSESEELRTALDRYGRAAVYHGSALTVMADFLVPAVDEAIARSKKYEVERAGRPEQQNVVELVFPDKTFEDYEEMGALCDAVREGDGLSVTMIHLNPYLQAQVLDFFTGAAADLVIMDDRTVSLIPRSTACSVLLERIAATVFRFFGEGEVRVSAASS